MKLLWLPCQTVMAVKTKESTVLLRRPLPPKVLSPLTEVTERNARRNCLSSKKKKLQKKTDLAPLTVQNSCYFETDIFPQGPDPLPAREPLHVRDNPYNVPVDQRFISCPEFTLDNFLRTFQEDWSPPSHEQHKETAHAPNKQIVEYRPKHVFHRKIINNDITELPNPSSRKPQRQIIIELAATILLNTGDVLDRRITEILSEVETPKIQRPLWTQGGSRCVDLHGEPLSADSTLDDWSSDYSGAPDVAYTHPGNRTTMDIVATAHNKVGRMPISSRVETFSADEPFSRPSTPTIDEESAEIKHAVLTPAEFLVFEAGVKLSTALNLKAHFIHRLPNIDALLQNLTSVNLSFNNFIEIPRQIFRIENLASLNLRNNPIKVIPNDIAQLRHLQNLVVSFCMIKCLPKSLCGLSKLKILDVSYNSLSVVPKEIGKLRSLVELNVEGNQLGAFPTSIVNLHLKYFRINCNFTHPLFWRETTGNQPQRLFNLAARIVASHFETELLPANIRMNLQSKRRHECDCCDGPLFGAGVRIIQNIPEIFGVRNVPLCFTVCTQLCRTVFKKDARSIDNWLEKHARDKLET